MCRRYAGVVPGSALLWEPGTRSAGAAVHGPASGIFCPVFSQLFRPQALVNIEQIASESIANILCRSVLLSRPSACCSPASGRPAPCPQDAFRIMSGLVGHLPLILCQHAMTHQSSLFPDDLASLRRVCPTVTHWRPAHSGAVPPSRRQRRSALTSWCCRRKRWCAR